MIIQKALPVGGLFLSWIQAVLGEEGVAWTQASDDLPSWASENTLQLKLSSDSTNYAIIPLTEALAGGNSQSTEATIDISGNLRAADDTNYNTINSTTDIAYITCDTPQRDTYIDPGKILNELMKQRPEAIVLYSTARNWCSLSYKGDLVYTNILSMVDTGEASSVLDHINETSGGTGVSVSITGNTTNLEIGDGPGGGTDNKSTVAMSVLYSITGLITFLFLAIIVNGAIKAHRHPDRYGPRRAAGGRPRQSRAKGLARAVLETLPVVKFGDQRPSKPDPELEMDDTATTDAPIPAAAQGAIPDNDAGQPEASRSPRSSSALSEIPRQSTASGAEPPAENLGCSICTEDFKVGEDVRVLPCQHQFHPECVDPWLVNVSGTCPLCRLDLRPGKTNDASASGDHVLPPPLVLEQDGDTPDGSSGNSPSRLIDMLRLRQAPAEEQMEMLRQLREAAPAQDTPSAGGAASGGSSSDDQHQGARARLSNKLKEKFKILTRSQSARGQDE